MVNPPPPFQQQKGGRRRKAGGSEEKRRQDETTRETQWCSGITCVLARLRAHYPEHQHKKKKRKKSKRNQEDDGREEEDKRRDHTHHHRHSTMTQPCHKDTTPNQQRRDSKHKRWEGGKKRGRKTMQEGQEQCEGGPNPNTGQRTTPPAIQQGHRVNNKGDADTQTGDADIRRGVSNTAALHPPCHPPSTMPPHHPR